MSESSQRDSQLSCQTYPDKEDTLVPKILLGVSGGIAAYKACELLRLFQKQGCEVRVCVTPEAERFVGVATFEALTQHEVLVKLFEGSDPIPHITLAEWADAAVVVPATANSMAKLACGIADDALSTTLLALPRNTPLLLAPAMNVHMWQAAATQDNLETLERRGIRIISPVHGRLACGDVGAGKLADINEIFASVMDALDARTALRSFDTDPDRTMLLSFGQVACGEQDKEDAAAMQEKLAGKRVLITAGPTHEAIDPVRYIANASSGKMGFAIAEACKSFGAEVTLIAGPTSLATPEGVNRIDVVSASEMYQATIKAFENCDIAICAAAVADYKPADPADHKLKKGRENLDTIKLVRTRDILASLSVHKGERLVIGFAAETNDLLKNAQEKLAKKGCDLIVANDVSRKDSAFGGDTNRVSFVTAGGVEQLPTLSKYQVARALAEHIANMLAAKTTSETAHKTSHSDSKNDIDATVVRPRLYT